MEWSVSVAHEGDQRILGVLALDELPAEGETVDVPTMVPPELTREEATEAGIPTSMTYEVVAVEADEESGTATITVHHLEGGWRQMGV